MAETFNVEGEMFRYPLIVWQREPLDSPVISVARHRVASDKKDEFMDKFRKVSGILHRWARARFILGGWRLEKENNTKEEWVLFVR